jgi:hypothetical protein
MINLVIGIFIFCTSFGITIAKTNNNPAFRKSTRQHLKPLSIDKDFATT